MLAIFGVMGCWTTWRGLPLAGGPREQTGRDACPCAKTAEHAFRADGHGRKFVDFVWAGAWV